MQRADAQHSLQHYVLFVYKTYSDLELGNGSLSALHTADNRRKRQALLRWSQPYLASILRDFQERVSALWEGL